MKISISVATFLMVGAGVAGLGAATNLENPFQGSDTLFNVTQDSITELAAIGFNLGPASAYVGGGSGNGQSALVSGGQHIAPMSRMINSGACASNLTNASGVVIGLDGVDVYWNSGGTPVATCNAPGAGLAFNGANGQGFGNYKDVLALVYGGKDNTAGGAVDCNSAKRNTVVNNWSDLFQNNCSNTEAVCSDTAHELFCSVGGSACSVAGAVCNVTGVCTNSGTARLWHAFRRDDASGTSDVFATILGISPNTSASTLNGFGASPYCNALNWDTSTTNANCGAGTARAGLQFIGPGGVPQGACSSTLVTPPVVACVIGATYCTTAPTLRCDPAPAPNTCPGGGTCTVTAPPMCPVGDTCVAEPTKHRRPPLNTWGDDPDPNRNTRCSPGNPCADADVLPTSFQDNDPIRRGCIGSTVNTTLKAGEEVCNRNGTLGVVLPIAASDFIADLPDPNHAGAKLAQFANNLCGNYDLGLSTAVLSCAIKNASKHAGECPNGDLTFGANGTCEVPLDTANTTSQCLQAKSAGNIPIKQRGATTSSADGRVYNLHLHDGSTTSGLIGYAHETIPTATVTLSLDFAGAFNRIHQVTTIPLGTFGCTQKDSTDQIACLTHADKCSIGYAGDGGKTYLSRYANGTCHSCTPGSAACPAAPFQCSTNGNPCSYFSTSGFTVSGPCDIETQAADVVEPLLVNTVAPSPTTIQALGNGATEYPLARKLYLNSFNFSGGFDAGNPPFDDAGNQLVDGGITFPELTLAKFESNLIIGVCSSGVCSIGGAACAPEGSVCYGQGAPTATTGIQKILVHDGFFTLGANGPNGADTPFCEDFNQNLVCDAGFINDNACSRNPAGYVPNDISPDGGAGSTTCGNGVLDPFEECDPGLPSTSWSCSVPGATTCSSTCRC